MANGNKRPPFPENEPVLQYAPGSPERAELKAALDEMMGTRADIPLYIGGEEVRTGDKGEVHPPHEHSHLLGHFHQAGPEHTQQAIDAARDAWPAWSEMAWEARAAVFLKAADLLAGPYRARMNAATMLGQSKNCFQSEIDAACELIDFWRFNAWYLYQLYEEQPESAPGMWNSMEHRPLEGFVFAVSPFNFSSIGGNLPTAPALMGNTVVWKPAATAVYSAAIVMEILHEAGLPGGVINCIAGPSAPIGKACLESPELAGVHFTGSTRVFQMMWKEIGNNIDRYRSYPRIVGETGGKDFIFAHPTADVPSLATALVRGAFEYQGQKCSAASRAFIPSSLWDEVTGKVVEATNGLAQGSPLDFRNFLCAVIDKPAYDSIMGYVQHAHDSDDHVVLAGGEGDDSKGYFVRPTVVEAKSARSKLMVEEIFGPVLTLYRYEDGEIEQALTDCDEASPYGLTGAIFARDRGAIEHMATRLRHAAGNFYINDKPTGAVVGQQPFGGGRASGTNDKAGSVLNLVRWVSPRAIKETFDPPTDHRYPHMDEE